jgi:hypothetical protein
MAVQQSAPVAAAYAVIGWGLVMLIRILTAPRGTKPATS